MHKLGIMDAVESTYMCNPYRGSSLDLIQAVARQYKFAFRVSQSFNWDLPQGIIKGIRQYSRFLHLIKTYPNLTAVPTIEIGNLLFQIILCRYSRVSRSRLAYTHAVPS